MIFTAAYAAAAVAAMAEEQLRLASEKHKRWEEVMKLHEDQMDLIPSRPCPQCGRTKQTWKHATCDGCGAPK